MPDEHSPHEIIVFAVMIIVIVFMAILLFGSVKADAQEAPGQLTLGDPILLGDLDKEADLRPVIEDNLEYLYGCYDHALNQDPELYGRTVIKYIITDDGTVSSVKVNTTSLHDEMTETCLCTVFKQMVFPPPRESGIVIVTQALTIGKRPARSGQLYAELSPALNGPPRTVGSYDLLPREEDQYLTALEQEVEAAEKAVNNARTLFNTMALLPQEDPHKVKLLTESFSELEKAIDRHEAAIEACDEYRRLHRSP
ncbi:MAG: AgmX/PglI C-terminal domain-containing protein [Candidatus Uhrbacteria bacterium]